MKNNKRLFLAILVIFGVNLSFTSFWLKAIAQKSPTPAPSPSRTTQPKRQRSTWEAILTLFKLKKEPSSGSRSRVCLVSPGLLEKVNVIWSDRPLFLWQGYLSQFEIRLYLKLKKEALWSKTVTTDSPTITSQSVQYNGEALQPGNIYDWELIDRSEKKKLRYSFQVMGLEKRAEITEDLASLEEEIRAEGANIEEIALERANYLAKQGLWSDALQEMYSVQNPSSELTDKTQELLKYLCEQPTPENVQSP